MKKFVIPGVLLFLAWAVPLCLLYWEINMATAM
jgi:hypothetical protein